MSIIYMAAINNGVPLKENEMAAIATNSAVAIAGPPPSDLDKLTDSSDLAPKENVPAVVEPTVIEDPAPEPPAQPAPEPRPVPVPVAMPPVSLPKEIIVEEEVLIKPKGPRLEEESFKEEVELIPVVRRSRKKRSASKSSSKKTRKYHRCKKNHRRNPKTHRCNTKCPPGKKKNATNKRCINKGGKKRGKK